jgi:hypothetical protein
MIAMMTAALNMLRVRVLGREEEQVARTPQEVFQHHAEALGAEDIDAIVSDYADDAIFMTPDGVLRGKDGVRRAFEKLTSEVPGARWELPTQLYEDDILLLEWKATSSESKIEDGIDTFVSATGGSASRPSATPCSAHEVTDARCRSSPGRPAAPSAPAPKRSAPRCLRRPCNPAA